MVNQEKVASQIARKAHGSQFRRDGITLYIVHPEAVANSFEKDEVNERAVAWLHDVLEDSDFTEEDILNHGILPEIVEAVSTLTKKPGVSYDEYIAGVLKNRLAMRVKIADMRNNLSGSPTEKAKLKYEKAIPVLEAALSDKV